MCGIVGYIGHQNAVEVVLSGLERLEYRGYDSAGICFKNNEGSLSLYKKSGKIENLKKVLDGKNHISTTCIGHTRWATHGEVNDLNAHPHISDSMTVNPQHTIVIVHNGIIENTGVLKKELNERGVKFRTQTDSEVFLGLLVIEMESGKGLCESIASAFRRIDGNSAFVIMTRDQREIYAIKRAAPLVCALNSNTGEVFASSDPYALAGMADELFFPDDEVICKIAGEGEGHNKLNFFDLDLTETNRFLRKKQDINFEISEKGTFEHFMLKEIYEQPGLIRNLIRYYFDGKGHKHLHNIKIEKEPERIHIVACGTAWHAGLIIKNFIESYNRIHCHIDLASVYRGVFYPFSFRLIFALSVI